MIENKYNVVCMNRYIKDNADGSRNEEPVIVQVPGSKSITNRALLLAVMADGRSRLEGVLFSDDSRHFNGISWSEPRNIPYGCLGADEKETYGSSYQFTQGAWLRH
jgi:hypothetical protein